MSYKNHSQKVQARFEAAVTETLGHGLESLAGVVAPVDDAAVTALVMDIKGDPIFELLVKAQDIKDEVTEIGAEISRIDKTMPEIEKLQRRIMDKQNAAKERALNSPEITRIRSLITGIAHFGKMLEKKAEEAMSRDPEWIESSAKLHELVADANRLNELRFLREEREQEARRLIDEAMNVVSA